MRSKEEEFKDSIAELKQQIEIAESNRVANAKQMASQEKALKRAAEGEEEDAKIDIAVEALMKDAAEAKQAGYDTFISAMMHIVNSCRLLMEAKFLNSFVKGVLGTAHSVVKAGVDKMVGGDSGMDLSPGAMMDGLTTYLSAETRPATLPDMYHFVEFTDNDKLNIASLSNNMCRSDGEKFTPEEESVMKKCLKRGVEAWLENRGYELQAGSQDVFVPTAAHLAAHGGVAGTPLTKAEFEALRDDPNYGLEQYLSGKFDVQNLHLEQAAGPTGPRP